MQDHAYETRGLDPVKGQNLRHYSLHSQAMAQLAIGTSVVIASLLVIPDGVALIPNASDFGAWVLSIIGIWISASVLWFVGFLAIMHAVRFFVGSVEVSDKHVKFWRFARPIMWADVAAIANEPQLFFTKVFSLKETARRLTIFELKKSWRKKLTFNLVPHHLPSFFFAPRDFDRMILDICQRKFGYVPNGLEVVVAQPSAFDQLRSIYKSLAWQRVLLSLVIALGLVMLLGRKAYVNFQYNSGNKAMSAQNLPRAKEMYSAALAMEPTFAAGWNNLGNTEFQMGDFVLAEKHWKRSLLYKPDFVEAKISLSYLYLQNREFSKAGEFIDSALKLAPMNPYALVNRPLRNAARSSARCYQ